MNCMLLELLFWVLICILDQLFNYALWVFWVFFFIKFIYFFWLSLCWCCGCWLTVAFSWWASQRKHTRRIIHHVNSHSGPLLSPPLLSAPSILVQFPAATVSVRSALDWFADVFITPEASPPSAIQQERDKRSAPQTKASRLELLSKGAKESECGGWWSLINVLLEKHFWRKRKEIPHVHP